MKTFYLFFVLVFVSAISFAQNVGINSDGSTPNASAMLDVKSSTKGFLVPRMTAVERGLISSPANGLLVYQTDGTSGFYYCNNLATWTLLGTGSGNGTVTSVATGTGLTGGPVTTTGTISLANTTVTAGSYTRATITVDAQGRITAAGDGEAVSLTAGVSGVLPIANGGTNASTANEARTNLGASTLGGNMFTLTNPSAITFPRFNANNTISSLTATEFCTAIGAGAGSGTVTSIAAGNGMSFTTITGSGSVTLGTPSTLTSATTNSVSGTTHEHAITTQLPSSATAGLMLQSGVKTAGGFYGGTTTPSSFIRANYDGYLYATRFYGDGSQLTGITATGYSGTLPVANGGTGTTTGSITGTGALTFTAGGTNQNVNITPSGTGYTVLGGNVGIGATSATDRINITDASTTAESSSLKITKTGTITGNAYGTKLNVSGGSTWSIGGYAEVTGTGSNNAGFYSSATGAAGVNYGLYGSASSGTSQNYGIFAKAGGSTGTSGSYAGFFDNNATVTAAKYGVYGRAFGVSTGTNYGGYFTAYNSTTANYALVTDQGNVGIGTLTPSSKLTVAGDVNITGTYKVNGTAINSGTVTSVSGTLPISVASGTTTPAISLGTVGVANGGTGQTTYDVGDLLYASTTSALSKLADVATGNSLISGGVGVAPSWGKIALTTHVSGTLPVANGGTGATTLTGYVKGTGTTAMTASATIPAADISGNITGNATNVTGIVAVANGGTGSTTATVAGGVVYGSSTSAMASTASGTSGQVLTSNGTSAPTWSSTASIGVAPVGSIMIWAGSTAPTGWLLCDGSLYSTTGTYAALYAVLTTTYGSGTGTFAVPNLKGKIPVGLNSADASFNTLGETGGEKTHTITTAELPAHTHTVDPPSTATSSNGDHNHSFSDTYNGSELSDDASDRWVGSDGTTSETDYTSTTGAHAHSLDVAPFTSGSTGSSYAMNVLQPYIVLYYIIKY